MNTKPAPPPTLREWLENSEFQGSVRHFAEALGVPFKTAQNWVYGWSIPAAANRAKIQHLTGVSVFSPPPPERTLRSKQTDDTKANIARTKELLIELYELLEYFRTHSPAAREILRQELSGGFAASIGTLLHLLFDEDRLRDWQGTRRMMKPRR